MNKCKKCGKPASTYIGGRPVQGTVAGTRYRKGNYYCQSCIDASAAAHKAYADKCLVELECKFAEAAARIRERAL